ncbi:MAG: MBL fold metallo-hydrolase [Gemmatimonadales bacterium]|nr:MBL fold metallo-hydrolase [Gemmatimonadales bacterium]
MRLTFHGAARTVTGSRHLLEAAGQRILVDCGMFQGLRKLRRMNWDEPGFEPGFLDHIILTHSHIDHTGYVPRMMKYGFQGQIHCTQATSELLELMLMDSAHIQEEDAAWAKKKGYSRHKSPEPLYTSIDALYALKLVVPQDFNKWVKLSSEVRYRFINSGHILGAGFVEIRIAGGDGSGVNEGETTLVFSGDLGRYNVPLHTDPEPLPACDVLIVESTYGKRSHEKESILDQIREDFERTMHKRGVVLIPSFAVGRTQLVALILRNLMRKGDLQDVPIHIDSPMAIDATAIYSRHLYDYNLDEDITSDGRNRLLPKNVTLHRTVHESKILNNLDGPRVIIAASGMMTGGRILHHLVRRLPNSHNLILLSGYQAVGTRGRALHDGAETLRMHGQNIPVEARVASMQGLSSHADGEEIMRWIGTAPQPPKRVFVVHGEPESAQYMAERIAEVTGAETTAPDLKEGFEI